MKARWLSERTPRRRWAEGRNIKLDVRWSSTEVAVIQRFAKELTDYPLRNILSRLATIQGLSIAVFDDLLYGSTEIE